MVKMAIMIGIQASGKSTFCKTNLPGYIRINLDELHTRNKESNAIWEVITSDLNIVIDNTNPTRADAILILYEGNRKLEYVPEKDNIIFARLMDAGKLLKAKITGITQKGTFKQISVGIYLVDF